MRIAISCGASAQAFKASKVVVHPYRAEGFGMHVQEAMACGCIPVVSDGGPTDDFVSHENGFRLPTERKSMNIADPNVFAMKSGDSMTGMSTHTFYNEPNGEALTNGLKLIYHSHNKEEEIYNKTAENEAKKREKTEAWINRFKSKASMATRAQSKIKMLEKTDKKEKTKN